MDTPRYILKANEGVLVPKSNKPTKGYLKTAILLLIILGSKFFPHEVLFQLSEILLLLFVIFSFKKGGSHRVPSPFEIWFYDDYLIVYREKRYYNKKVSRKEYNKFFYKDISQVVFRKSSQRINIYGVIEGIWYDYKKDGTLPEQPTYHRTTNKGMCYFYTTHAPEIDFVAEIEKNSPIKVACSA